MTSPGNSWNLRGKANEFFLDHSPSCLASTSNAYTWFDEVVMISTLLLWGENPPAVTAAPSNLDINQCCLLPHKKKKGVVVQIRHKKQAIRTA